MTSPRQRKKRFFIKRMAELKEKEILETLHEKTVEVPPPPVVESPLAQKTKKTKSALVELKPQDLVVEQTKEEVKTPTKE